MTKKYMPRTTTSPVLVLDDTGLRTKLIDGFAPRHERTSRVDIISDVLFLSTRESKKPSEKPTTLGGISNRCNPHAYIGTKKMVALSRQPVRNVDDRATFFARP